MSLILTRNFVSVDKTREYGMWILVHRHTDRHTSPFFIIFFNVLILSVTPRYFIYIHISFGSVIKGTAPVAAVRRRSIIQAIRRASVFKSNTRLNKHSPHSKRDDSPVVSIPRCFGFSSFRCS